MRSSILCVAGLLLAVPTLPAGIDWDLAGQKKPEQLPLPKEVKTPNIAGYWKCVGKGQNGKLYQGVATILKIESIYVVTYSVGGTTSHGAGYFKDGVLSVGWYMKVEGGLSYGVSVYKLQPGEKEFHGQVTTIPTTGQPLPETLILLDRMTSNEEI